MESEALLRHPGTGGVYDGYVCRCTNRCPAACDGARGCEACLRAWMDAGLDELIGSAWEGGDMKKKDVSMVSEPLRDALLAYSGLEPNSAHRV